jgi:hypothetical protein
MYLDALTVTHVDDTLNPSSSIKTVRYPDCRGDHARSSEYAVSISHVNEIHTRFGIPVADLEATDALHLYRSVSKRRRSTSPPLIRAPISASPPEVGIRRLARPNGAVIWRPDI